MMTFGSMFFSLLICSMVWVITFDIRDYLAALPDESVRSQLPSSLFQYPSGRFRPAFQGLSPTRFGHRKSLTVCLYKSFVLRERLATGPSRFFPKSARNLVLS